MYFRDSPSTPYLHKGTFSLDFDEKMNVLLLDVDSTKICCKLPNGAMEDAFFVVDRTQLKSANDWLVTAVGSFEHRGSSAKVYTILNGKIVASKVWANKRLEDLVMKLMASIWLKMCFTKTKSIQTFYALAQRS